MFVINIYFPYLELPELFMMYRLMVTNSGPRQLVKNMAMFSNDVGYIVEHKRDSLDESIFSTLFGKTVFINMYLTLFPGNLMIHVPKSKIQFQTVAYLRRKMVGMWKECCDKVNLSCENIKDRKYSTNNGSIVSGCILDINLMPLPTLLCTFPQLR